MTEERASPPFDSPARAPHATRDGCKCSRCGSAEIGRSHRRALERVLSLVGVVPFRCLDCDHRFYLLRRGG